MEESQFLVWMKRNQIFNSHNDILLQAPLTAPCNNSKSWEEKAFAEDAARILGGCTIWPPRSYSCSFCKREFRSAQALGGHMNVHRRDRARLQHHSTNTLQIEPFHNRRLNDSSKSLAAEDQFSAEICCLQDCYNLNPISSLSSSRDRAVDAKVGDQNICVQTDLSVGLNSLFGQKLPTSRSISDCKSAKTAAVSNSLPVLAFESDGIVLGIEDVDLELRLGKPQKI